MADMSRRTLAEWAEEVHRQAREKGWHFDGEDPWGEKVWKMLGNVSGEVAEAWEEAREKDFDAKRIYCKEGLGKDPYDADCIEQGHKPEGFPVELADVVIRVLDTARAMGIHLSEQAVFEGTMLYPVSEGTTWRRLCDIYDATSRAIREARWYQEGTRDDRLYYRKSMRQTLGAIVGHAERLAESEGIDLWDAVAIKHAYNATRPHRHGGKRA